MGASAGTDEGEEEDRGEGGKGLKIFKPTKQSEEICPENSLSPLRDERQEVAIQPAIFDNLVNV